MNSVTDTASFSIGDRRKRICTGFLFLVHFKNTINNNTKVYISQTHIRTHLYVVRILPYTSSRVDCVNVILKCVINCQSLFQVQVPGPRTRQLPAKSPDFYCTDNAVMIHYIPTDSWIWRFINDKAVKCIQLTLVHGKLKWYTSNNVIKFSHFLVIMTSISLHTLMRI